MLTWRAICKLITDHPSTTVHTSAIYVKTCTLPSSSCTTTGRKNTKDPCSSVRIAVTKHLINNRLKLIWSKITRMSLSCSDSCQRKKPKVKPSEMPWNLRISIVRNRRPYAPSRNVRSVKDSARLKTTVWSITSRNHTLMSPCNRCRRSCGKSWTKAMIKFTHDMAKTKTFVQIWTLGLSRVRQWMILLDIDFLSNLFVEDFCFAVTLSALLRPENIVTLLAKHLAWFVANRVSNSLMYIILLHVHSVKKTS